MCSEEKIEEFKGGENALDINGLWSISQACSAAHKLPCTLDAAS